MCQQETLLLSTTRLRSRYADALRPEGGEPTNRHVADFSLSLDTSEFWSAFAHEFSDRVNSLNGVNDGIVALTFIFDMDEGTTRRPLIPSALSYLSHVNRHSATRVRRLSGPAISSLAPRHQSPLIMQTDATLIKKPTRTQFIEVSRCPSGLGCLRRYARLLQ